MSRTTSWSRTFCSWALGSRIGCAMPRKNQIGKGLSTFISHFFRTGYAPAVQLESAVARVLGSKNERISRRYHYPGARTFLSAAMSDHSPASEGSERVRSWKLLRTGMSALREGGSVELRRGRWGMIFLL